MSTMENPEDSHDTKKKEDSIPSVEENPVKTNHILNDNKEGRPNSQHMLNNASIEFNQNQKREFQNSALIHNNTLDEKMKEDSGAIISEQCAICEKADFSSVIFNCKICRKSYHSECMSIKGMEGVDNKCGSCIRSQISSGMGLGHILNPNVNQNLKNFGFNNIQNLSMMNDILKNNFNRGINTSRLGPGNNFTTKTNMGFPKEMPFGTHNLQQNIYNHSQQMPNMNMPTPNNTNPNMMMLLQMMNKDNTNNNLFNPLINNNQNSNKNPLIQTLLNKVAQEPALNTNPNNNANYNLLAQMLLNINKNKQTNPENLRMMQNLQAQISQLPNQTLFNLINKQNNVTNFNFFNNLVNYSQAQTNPQIKNNNDHFANNSKINFTGVKQSNDNNFPKKPMHLRHTSVKKYPVDDNLIAKNPEIYDVDPRLLERPKTKELNVPRQSQTKLFFIWDFLHSFSKIFDSERKLHTFANIEEFNQALKEPHNDLFNNLVVSTYHLFLHSASAVDSLEYEEEKGLLLLKTMKENINTNHHIVLKRCWLDILIILIESRKFSSLASNDLKELKEKIKENADSNFSNEEKIEVLFYLFSSTMELPRVRDMIKSEYEKQNCLVRDKISLKLDYRSKDARKKEIERSDKFLQAPKKIEQINKKILEIENATNIHPKTLNKMKKEQEIEKERYLSLIKENEDLQKVKELIIERRNKIKIQLEDMVINFKRSLGFDLFNNEYFFFKTSPSTIYVKQTVNKSKSSSWSYYDTKEEIQNLYARLLDKGVRERKFKYKLKKVFELKMEFGNKIEDNEEMVVEDIRQIQEHGNSLSFAVEILMKIENKFSEYLAQFSKEWESPTIKIKWKDVLTSNPTFKNCVSSLILFNTRFKNPYRNDESTSEEMEVEDEENKLIEFTDHSGHVVLQIKEFDNTRHLAPKVKIWSKDLETHNMEKYFNESLVPSLKTDSNLYLVLQFFESIIFSLIKRRESVAKKNMNLMKEISDGHEVFFTDIENREKHKIEQENSEEEPEKPEDKTVSVVAEIDVEQTESIVQPSEPSSERKKSPCVEILGNINKTIPINEICQEEKTKKKPAPNRKTEKMPNSRKKRNSAPKQLKINDWRETCYICLEYGELICCDGCSNAAHLFCAYLDKNPDDWYCENCEDKLKKKKIKYK